MFQKTVFGSIVASALCLGAAFPAAAQSADGTTFSAEEMAERFRNQKTRGLVLAPTGGAATEPTAEASTAPAEETYVQLPADQQVSIQISFDFDSAALRADQAPKLETLCQVINTVDIDVFRIVGHTDASGSASYNESLSLLRAQEVKRHLVTECGIAETRLEAVGVGESFLLDQADPNGDVNRRVEFQALS